MRKKPQPQLVLMGQQIRAQRAAKGFSQESFALEAAMARSYFSGVERGRRNLSAINIMRIADVLGCEVGELFPRLRDLRKAKQK